MSKSRLGSMGKLSDFGQTQETSKPAAPSPAPLPSKAKKKKTKAQTAAKLTTVNIKIRRDQQRWLQDQAQLVRDNNLEPVPANERVYPQHLIQAAIDLLQSQDIDWDQVKDAKELRDKLNI